MRNTIHVFNRKIYSIAFGDIYKKIDVIKTYRSSLGPDWETGGMSGNSGNFVTMGIL